MIESYKYNELVLIEFIELVEETSLDAYSHTLILHINEAQLIHSGVFICKAKSRFGEKYDERQIMLNIESKFNINFS